MFVRAFLSLLFGIKMVLVAFIAMALFAIAIVVVAILSIAIILAGPVLILVGAEMGGIYGAILIVCGLVLFLLVLCCSHPE